MRFSCFVFLCICQFVFVDLSICVCVFLFVADGYVHRTAPATSHQGVKFSFIRDLLIFQFVFADLWICINVSVYVSYCAIVILCSCQFVNFHLHVSVYVFSSCPEKSWCKIFLLGVFVYLSICIWRFFNLYFCFCLCLILASREELV